MEYAASIQLPKKWPKKMLSASRLIKPTMAVLIWLATMTAVNAQSFTTLTPTIKARSEASVIEYRGDLYVFNGFAPNIDIEPTIEKFSVATKRWSVIGTTSSQKGTAVTHNGLVRHGKDVWMIGGRVGDNPGKVSNKTWIYNLDTKVWRQGPSMPMPVASGGAALVNNRIHWFGGIDPFARCDVDNHYVYDLSEPTAGWQNITSVARMPEPRNHFATVVLNGLIYAIGGQNGHDGCRGNNRQDLTSVHAFNPVTMKWQKKADLPSPQSHAEPSTFAYKGYIYSVGGRTNGNKVQRYNPETNKWATVLTMPAKLLAPIARVVDGKLLVASGGAPNTVTPTKVVRLYNMKFPVLNADVQDTEEQVNNVTTDTVPTNDVALNNSSIISVEAEYHDDILDTATHSWVHQSMSGASNSDAMITTPDYGALVKSAAGSPKLTYLLNFDKPGKYYLWIRGWGDTDALGVSDSLHAGLNGKLLASADKIDQFPSGWNWSNSTRDKSPASIDIPSSGVHAVNIWMREDGLAIDKFLLTSDKNYVPTGTGPEDNDGASIDTSVDVTPTSTVTTTDEVIDEEPVDTPTTGDVTTNVSVPDDVANAFVSIDASVFKTNNSAGTHKWVSGVRPGASGSGSMVTNLNRGVLRAAGTSSPMLSYAVNFPIPGTYKIWVRAWGDTQGNEGKNDSLHVGIDGKANSAQTIQNFPARWSWSSAQRGGGQPSVTVASAGMHTINVWMREDGLEVDRLILTTDKTFVPVSFADVPTVPATQEPSTETSTTDTTETDQQNTTTNSEGEQVVDASTQSDPDSIYIDVAAFDEMVFDQGGGAQHKWINGSRSGSSGRGSMVTNINNGTLKRNAGSLPMMSYRVNFATSGNYYIWLRGWGDTDTGEGRNDSVHIGINSKLTSANVVQNFPSRWSWTNERRGGGRPLVSVPTAGEHTINVWMREDGLELDTLLLVKDAAFKPELGDGDTGSAGNTTDNTDTDSNTGSNTNGPGTSTSVTASIAATATWRNVNTVDGSRVVVRHEAGGVEMNGKLYVLGGRGTRNVSVFDPATNRWSKKSASPIELNHFQPVAWGNKIWVIGAFTGRYPDETSVPHIYSYTPATDTWRKEGAIPESRRRGGAGAALHNGRILLVGGNTNGHRAGAKAWVDAFNPATGQWQTLADAPAARDHATIAIAAGKLVVAGGRLSSQPNVFANTVSRTDVLTLATGNWTRGAAIPTQRAGTMTVAVGNEVIVIGGESLFAAGAHRDVEAYNVLTNKWRKLKPLSIGRHSGAAVVLGNAIHVVTGSERRGGSPESNSHEAMAF